MDGCRGVSIAWREREEREGRCIVTEYPVYRLLEHAVIHLPGFRAPGMAATCPTELEVSGPFPTKEEASSV